jgi:ABC-type nickel/cobalt efflux system permease component RcnA
MGICICICVTAIIISLIIAGCYYLENRSMQDQEAAMDLCSGIFVLSVMVWKRK